MKKIVFAIIICLFAFGTSFKLQASWIKNLDLAELVQLSDEIIEGKVEKIEYEWDSKGKYIYSYIFIKPAKSFLTVAVSDVIIIKEIGGHKNGIILYAPRRPEFSIGEYVLVFLKRRGEFYSTVGLSSGKFAIYSVNAKQRIERTINVDRIPATDENAKSNFKEQFDFEDFLKLTKTN